jgi:hypothetical protein
VCLRGSVKEIVALATRLLDATSVCVAVNLAVRWW